MPKSLENVDKTKLVEFNDGKGTFHSIVQISNNILLDEETGYLTCKNSVLGGVGVQKYYGKEIGLTGDKADKVIEMVRDSEDVFNAESLKTFIGKPVTLLHPKGKVNSGNIKKFQVGALLDARQDSENLDNLAGDLIIYDEYSVDKVKKGELKDLSLGYRAKIVPLADGRYKQTEIVINHLAIVEEGRAEMATIVDNKTVVEDELEPKDYSELIKDTVFVNESVSTTHRVNTYDDETGEENTKEITTYERNSKKYDDLKKQMIDNKPKENEMKKDFKYYIGELKELAAIPKSEFRDAAYNQLAENCKEDLGVELPTIKEFTDSAKESTISRSVGLVKDTELKDEEPEEKPLTMFAKDEDRFFKKLYRSMDNVDRARELSSMTYHDVVDMITEGRTI